MPNMSDFATSLITAAPSPANSGTTFSMNGAHYLRFPVPPFYAVVHPDGQLPTIDNAEKIQVTGLDEAGAITATRGLSPTTAKNIAVGWRISNVLFKDNFDEIEGQISTLSGELNANFLPYIGATQSLNMGGYEVYSNAVRSQVDTGISVASSTPEIIDNAGNDAALSASPAYGAGNGGRAIITAGSADTQGDGGNVYLQVGAGAGTGLPGKFELRQGGSSFALYLAIAGLTAARNISFPDASGTLALTSDITNLSSVYLSNTGLKVKDTDASHGLIIAPGSNLTADRTLTVTTGDASRTLTMTANTSLGGGTHSGTNTGDQTTITGNAGTATSLQTARTIGTLTGDVTSAGSTFNGTANNTNATTLATVNSNVGSFGTASNVPTVTVNAKGLTTAASNTPIQIAQSQVTSLTTDLAAKQNLVTLTTTGTSGAATFNQSTGALNIPSYSGGGTTVTLFNVKRVAASTASTAEKASADYVCDGTADDVEINLALQAVKTAGGTVELSAGTFNLAATLFLEGDNSVDAGKNIALIGQGNAATILAPSSGVHAVTLRYMPKPIIMNLKIQLLGASDGIRAIANTTGANDRRGFWHGYFLNLDIRADGGSGNTHTGWGMNLENPFRSTFTNVHMGNLKNGLWLKSVYQSDQGNQFNPGNCTFNTMQIGASISGGVAYKIQSADLGGFINILTFIECDAFGSNSSDSIGWHFIGSTTSYFTVRDIQVLSSNVEQFGTSVKFEKAANVRFHGWYMDAPNNGTIFDVSANSQNIQLEADYIYVGSGPKTNKVLNDLNTNALLPTTLRQSAARVESGSTLTLTKTSATVLERLYRDSDGTGVYPTEWQAQTTALTVKDEGSELFRGTRSINFTGGGVTATNSTGDVTVNIPGPSVMRVVHGSVGSTARPTGATYVEWVGTATPANAIANDTWVDTN